MEPSSATETAKQPDEAFRLAAAQVLDERASQIVGLSKGLLDVTDTEPAELMWLATRRLRAAIELFRPCLTKSQFRGGRAEVKSIVRAVGARRDIDVAIEAIEVIGAEMGHAEKDGIAQLVDRLRRRQADANRALAQVVHGRRMQAFRVRIEDLAQAAAGGIDGEVPAGYRPLDTVPDSAIEQVADRLARLRASVPAALEPDAVREQHRMRVSAERLRYSLELTAEGLGSQAHTARRAARGLQEILGEVRDCDLAIPAVREQIALLEAEDIETIANRARGNRDLDPILVQASPNRSAYRGLELAIVHLAARRQMMYERFKRLWQEQSRQGVWVALDTSLR